MCSVSFKDIINKMCLQIIYLIYMITQDLALNNLQWLICHKLNETALLTDLYSISGGFYNES